MSKNGEMSTLHPDTKLFVEAIAHIKHQLPNISSLSICQKLMSARCSKIFMTGQVVDPISNDLISDFLGVSVFKVHGDFAELLYFVINQKCQRLGLGKLLMFKLKTHLQAVGIN